MAGPEVRVYVDVDGVINAVSRSTPDWGWADEQQAVVNGFPIRWSPSMVDRLNLVAARPETQMRWVTTWGRDAPGMICPALGVRGAEWAVLGAGGLYAELTGGSWWKLDAVRDDLPIGTPGVWLDDDIRHDAAALEWVHSRGDVLAIAPYVERGLTPDHLARVEAFVEQST